MEINKAYEAFKYNFDLRRDTKQRLLFNLPFLSTMRSINDFRKARSGVYYGDLNKNERISFAIRSALGFIPGVNLLLFPIMGLATLVCKAVDGVKATLEKRRLAKSQAPDSLYEPVITTLGNYDTE